MAIGDIQEGDTVQFEGLIKDEDDAVIDLDALTLTSQKLNGLRRRICLCAISARSPLIMPASGSPTSESLI